MITRTAAELSVSYEGRPQLETMTDPLANWNPIPFALDLPDDAALKSGSSRLYSFASIPHHTSVGERRYLRVEAEVPRMWCRAIYDEDKGAGDEGLPGDILTEIQDLAFSVMAQGRIPAMAIAIADPVAGWRIRVGFTRAPLAYPDTYPETPFRIGSTAKILTAVSAWVALQNTTHPANPARDETTKIFDLLPPEFQPSTGVGETDYPAGVLDLQFGHCFQYVCGWSDKKFHVYNSGGVDQQVVDAVAAGLPDEMGGWKTDDARGLLPMMRKDMLLFVLRKEAYSQYAGSGGQPPGFTVAGPFGNPSPSPPYMKFYPSVANHTRVMT